MRSYLIYTGIAWFIMKKFKKSYNAAKILQLDIYLLKLFLCIVLKTESCINESLPSKSSVIQ